MLPETTTTTAPRPAESTTGRRDPELERRLEAHLLIARRVRR